jgi:DNA-binding transcriptional LysR family regulator
VLACARIIVLVQLERLYSYFIVAFLADIRKSLIHKWSNDVKHLGDIALFVEVVRTRSFRRAASALGMPNSTLSRRIEGLEQALGLRLLNRTTRQIELTEAGRIYFERTKHIVDEARVIHEQLGDVLTQPTGTLRVSLPVDFARIFLTPLLPEFCQRYPDVSFALNLTPQRVDLVAEPFDLAIRMGALPDSQLIAHKLTEIPRGLYASPKYLNLMGIPEIPDHLASHDCFLFPWEERWLLTQNGSETGIHLNGRFRLNNVGMMQALAIEGLGIAMLAQDAVATDLAEGRLVTVLDNWTPYPISVHAVTETRLLPARTRVFIDFLKTRLRGTGAAPALPNKETS